MHTTSPRFAGILAALALSVGAGVAAASQDAAARELQAQQGGGEPLRTDLSERAEAARTAGRTDEALALYRKELAARPRWADGWWRLGTLLYDTDAYAEAAEAFRRYTALNPGDGTVWVMLGLSEYQLGRHDPALGHIQKGKRLGTIADPQFRRVMLYHEGLLLLGRSEFEQAQEVLQRLGADDVEGGELVSALGMAVLRIRPSDVQDADVGTREMLRRAGLAEHLAARKRYDDALRAYEQLVAEYQAVRNVHYALGRHFVATSRPDEAVVAYEREIQRFPDHVPARLGIAAIKADADPAAALVYAEEAVKLNPRIPLGHYLLGTLLLHTADTARAIAELEIARRAVPGDPGVHYALGRAYARAGRRADAARARAEFKRLTDERQAAARRDATAGDTETPPQR